ncbi:MAG TPA: iron dicitrate transport regulator FecR [Burkholderiaceae bacterium]|nr:iron dicitrate transport regulator FecR [Burkholderiaceae bacterium]
MSQHILLNRSENEVLWFRRRGFLQAAAAWTALGGYGAALAQGSTNVVDYVGDATVNGSRLERGQSIQTGDTVQTGPGSQLIFVVGNSSFHLRQNTRVTVERGASLFAVNLLRLITGGVASVWGKGTSRQIVTPTLTAGIRGTGVYAEYFEPRNRSYFCNCYGTVDLSTATESRTSVSSYHEAIWADPVDGGDRARMAGAPAINHTDEELEFLARLIGERTAWQISGVKGTKSGYGGAYGTN